MVLGILEWGQDVHRHAVSTSISICDETNLTLDSLAMAEMTTLVATIYRKYHTTIGKGFENTTPAITARVEIFHEERMRSVQVGSALPILYPIAYPSE